MKEKFITKSKTILSDIITPVSVYLKVRDKFQNALLLETTIFKGDQDNYSIVCFDPVATFKAEKGQISISYPKGRTEEVKIVNEFTVSDELNKFTKSFQIEQSDAPMRVEGFFGYCSYDAVQYFETIKFATPTKKENEIPEILFSFYRYIIAFNHFKSEMYIIENIFDDQKSNLDEIESIIKSSNYGTFSFKAEGNEVSNMTDGEFRDLVSKGKHHCFRGDVFQIVLSRQFSQKFTGDEFNVYRALRSINPSPYLFYFDFGTHKIFGSSPESQIVIRDQRAIINPIAGTFKRTGDEAKDAELAKQLANDPKENAEHIMLVDLARNDLSRNGSDVRVDNYREIHYYSHVLHMVSRVSGKLENTTNPIRIMADTFPAGTLSGAPKFKAMELINTYENQGRGYYGGCLGYIDLNGNINQAIMIRSFLSKDNCLYYQAGAGVVAKSVEESELQEVNNKLGALKKAIELAHKI